MSREERIELMTSVVTKLDEAAMLLTQAEEAIFAIKWTSLLTLLLWSPYRERMPRRYKGRLQPPLPNSPRRSRLFAIRWALPFCGVGWGAWRVSSS